MPIFKKRVKPTVKPIEEKTETQGTKVVNGYTFKTVEDADTYKSMFAVRNGKHKESRLEPVTFVDKKSLLKLKEYLSDDVFFDMLEADIEKDKKEYEEYLLKDDICKNEIFKRLRERDIKECDERTKDLIEEVRQSSQNSKY